MAQKGWTAQPLAALTEELLNTRLIRFGESEKYFVTFAVGKGGQHQWFVGEGSAHPYIGKHTDIARVNTPAEVIEEMRKLGATEFVPYQVGFMF